MTDTNISRRAKNGFTTSRNSRLAIVLLAGGYLGFTGVASAQLTWMWRTLAGVPGERGHGDSPGPQARFNQPHGIVIDAAGDAYIADRNNNTIRRITAQGVVTTVAGSPTAGLTNASGTAARFSGPSGIARDSAGILYIADRGNNCIRKILPSGAVSTLAGQTTAGGDDATGTSAKFRSPAGVAVDAAGNVYVADSGNHTIRQITPGGVVTTLAGTAGSSGTANGTGTAARFNAPEGIALHPDGTLLVTEAGNHAIRRVTMGGLVTTFAGQVGTPGAGGGSTATASFRSPAGITVGPDGMVFLVDGDNQTVRRITPEGQVQNLAGQPGAEGAVDGTGPAARFRKPYGVALAPGGTLLVTDRDNSIVRHMTPLGLVTLFAGQTGSAAFADADAAPARFNFPVGITADTSGHIYVSDYYNHTIRKISPAGVVTTIAGSAEQAGSADAMGTDARFRQPRGMTVDPSGNIYIADTGNHTIRKIEPSGLVSTVAGEPGAVGHFNAVGPNARFDRPMNLDWLPLYNSLVVSDMGNHVVREVKPSTRAVTAFAGIPGFPGVRTGARAQALFASPCGIAISPNSEVFITNYSGETIARMTGNYDVDIVAGKHLEKGSSDGGLGVSRFRDPAGMDSDGFLVVITDTTDNTIRTMVPGAPHTVTTIGGRAGRFGTRDGLGQAARFYSPHGVVKAPNGDIYVADSGNHRVLHGKAYASPWTAWQAYHNVSSGASGDDDRDGSVNLLEFAFGTPPRSGAGGVATASGGVLTSRGGPSVILEAGVYYGLYPVRLDSNQISLRYTTEFSSDLQDWTAHAGVTVSRGVDEEMNLLSVRFPQTLPNGKTPRFFRVVVSQM